MGAAGNWDDVTVDRVAADGGGFLVASGGDRLWADNVVVATGAFHHPRIPALARGLGEDIVQLHSSAYRRPAQLREGGVRAGEARALAQLALGLEHAVRALAPGVVLRRVRPGSQTLEGLQMPAAVRQLAAVGEDSVAVRGDTGL